jgi:hypothetical protein
MDVKVTEVATQGVVTGLTHMTGYTICLWLILIAVVKWLRCHLIMEVVRTFSAM